MASNRFKTRKLNATLLIATLVNFQRACRAQQTVSCGDTVIDSNVGEPNLVGESSGDVVYEFELIEQQRVTISTCTAATDFDTRLRLFDDSSLLNQIEQDDDGGNGECISTSSKISRSLSSGTYFIVVEGYGTRTGTFGMSVTCSDVLSTGAIVGIVVGSVVFCCCFCGSIAWCCRACCAPKKSTSLQARPNPVYQQQPQQRYTGQPQPAYTVQSPPPGTLQPQPIYTGQPQPVYTGQTLQMQPGAAAVAMQPIVITQPAAQGTFSTNPPTAPANQNSSFQPPSNPQYLPEPDEPPPAYDDFDVQKP